MTPPIRTKPLTNAQAHAARLEAQGFDAIGKGFDVIVTFAGLTFAWPARHLLAKDADATLQDLCEEVGRRVLRDQSGWSDERGPHDFSGVERALAAVFPAHREALRAALTRRLQSWESAITETTAIRQRAVDEAQAKLAKEKTRLAQIVDGYANARAALGLTP